MSDKLQQRIFKITMPPSHWEVDKPNLISKFNAYEICTNIFERFKLMPTVIAPSMEEGLYILYDYIGPKGKYSLIIETYNTNDSAIVIVDNDKKVVIYNEDIEEE